MACSISQAMHPTVFPLFGVASITAYLFDVKIAAFCLG
jgi:hypothetical protein